MKSRGLWWMHSHRFRVGTPALTVAHQECHRILQERLLLSTSSSCPPFALRRDAEGWTEHPMLRTVDVI